MFSVIGFIAFKRSKHSTTIICSFAGIETKPYDWVG